MESSVHGEGCGTAQGWDVPLPWAWGTLCSLYSSSKVFVGFCRLWRKLGLISGEGRQGGACLEASLTFSGHGQ